jgi:nucleoside-diphosphate-sugar epimerase
MAARHRFGTAVVISTCSVYADAKGRSLEEAAERGSPEFDGPIGEGTPTIAPGPHSYAPRKVAIEQALLASGVPVTILRPCAIYGVHATHPREWWLIKRGLDGRRKIPVAFAGESVFHTSSAEGVASLAELCLRSPETRVLNVADPVAHTIAELARCIEAATGLEIPLAPFPGPPAGCVGDTPWSSPHRFALDCSEARALGWDGGKSYAEAIEPYCKWMLETAKVGDWRTVFTAFARYADDPFDYATEDAFLNAPRNPPGYGP